MRGDSAGWIASCLLLVGCSSAEPGLQAPPGVAQPNKTWQTMTHVGISVDVPSNWKERTCGRSLHVTPRDDCGQAEPGLHVFHGVFDTVMNEGELLRSEHEGRALWSGYVERGGQTVLVRAFVRADARRSLDSVAWPSGRTDPP
jgi:hypothetical protein